jgi:hypothetical protein
MARPSAVEEHLAMGALTTEQEHALKWVAATTFAGGADTVCITTTKSTPIVLTNIFFQ